MTYISYAQNFEDVILSRALKDVEKGFYIDIGAGDPVIDSVTKVFYDLGWRGINIEPVKKCFKKLQKDRPDDINLQLAVGGHEGESDFYEVIGTGLSTTDKSIAERHVREGGYKIKEYKVPTSKLSAIFEQHPNPNIHFLRIDVGGVEKSVLLTSSLKKFRPWIILIQSMVPNSTTANVEDWERIILDADYDYVYFDGLNRFYVAQEHQDITDTLAIPPNILDDFVLSGSSRNSLHRQIAQIQTSLADAYEQRELLEAVKLDGEHQINKLETHVQNLQESATQRDEFLRDKYTKLQELQLSLSEKETQQQISEAALTGFKQQISQLKAYTQEIQTESAQREELLGDREKELKTVTSSLAETEKQLASKKSQLQAIVAAHKELKLVIEGFQKQAQAVQEGLIHRDWLLRDTKAKQEELNDSNQQLKSELEVTAPQVSQLQRENLHWQQEAERFETELRAVYDSKSWRVTLPLRKLWKPFEKEQKMVALHPAEESSQNTQEIHAHNGTEQLSKVFAHDKKISTDEICKRIRAELESTDKDNA